MFYRWKALCGMQIFGQISSLSVVIARPLIDHFYYQIAIDFSRRALARLFDRLVFGVKKRLYAAAFVFGELVIVGELLVFRSRLRERRC